MLHELWAAGEKSFKIEKTEHRWIAYRAERTASKKKGVVAFRVKSAATARRTPAPVPVPVSRPPVPRARPVPQAIPIPLAKPRPVPPTVTRSPGWPQGKPATPAPRVTPVSMPEPELVLPPLVLDIPPSAPKLAILSYGAGLKPKPPNPAVTRLQGLLGIGADGRFGKGTRTAVNAFQRSHGLKVDGSVGKDTWAALLAGG